MLLRTAAVAECGERLLIDAFAMEVPMTEERICVLQNRVHVLCVFVNTIDLLFYLLRYRKQVTVQIVCEADKTKRH